MSDYVIQNPEAEPPSQNATQNENEIQLLIRQTVMLTEALQTSQQVVQNSINQLNATTTNQGEDIARLDAAMNAMPCPNGYEHINEETHAIGTATIAECTSSGKCDCQAGLILTSPTWVPPPPSPVDP